MSIGIFMRSQIILTATDYGKLVKNRFQRGLYLLLMSNEATMAVAWPTIRLRSTNPKYLESALLSLLSPIINKKRRFHLVVDHSILRYAMSYMET